MLPLERISTTDKVPVNVGETIVLFSNVCVALSVTNSSVVLVNPSLDGNEYTLVKPAVKFTELNFATLVSSTELGTMKLRSLIAKTDPKRILPVPCADSLKSKFWSASSLASISVSYTHLTLPTILLV